MSRSRARTAPAKKASAKRAPVERAPTKRAPVKKALVEKTLVEKTLVEKTLVEKAPLKGAVGSARHEAAFQKIRELCLALPDTKLTMTWGSPHFRVGEKIFCGFGAEDGRQVMDVKLELSHARSIVTDPRFWPAPYVGKHGWISMDVARRRSWNEVRELIHESYGLIAPKASRAKLR